MKFITYIDGNKEIPGIMSEDLDSVHALSDAGIHSPDMIHFIESRTDADMAKLKELSKKSGKALSSVKLLAPIPRPHHNIFCLGLNYMDHVAESKNIADAEKVDEERPSAIYFSKYVTNAVGPDGEIDSHQDILKNIDYEAELGVVIGKRAKKVKENPWDYVFGLVAFNDVSGRDLQFRHGQWFFGKSLDDFTAFGPWIVTMDEFELPLNLQVQCRVNGETRQNNNTSNMIFPVEHIIPELSAGLTLEPGVIIATGTPSGVGMAMNPPACMKPGDICEIDIEGCGVLRNVIK